MLSIDRITAGIDWLSASLAVGSRLDHEWLSKGHDLLLMMRDEGYDLKRRSMLGFDGIGAGNCFAGSNERHHYMQFSGYHADWAFPVLYREDMHTSRIDLQLTVQFTTEQPHIAKEGYANAAIDADSRNPTRKRKVFLIIGNDGGDTVYIGAPSSAQRGRIYNKARQSGEREFERSWRYEVCFRNDVAVSAASSVYAGVGTTTHRIVSIVRKWYDDRGVPCHFLADAGSIVVRRSLTVPTDVERQIEWIESQVRPTVQRLIGRGFRDRVFAALGLSDDGEVPLSPLL